MRGRLLPRLREVTPPLRSVLGFCTLSVLGCSGSVGTSPTCTDSGTQGSWTALLFPDSLGRRVGVGTGDEFLLVGGVGRCFFCMVHELDEGTLSWRSLKTDVEDQTLSGQQVAASDRYVAATGLTTVGRDSSLDPIQGIVVLDRSANSWAIVPPPPELAARYSVELHWTGQEFVVFGGNVATDGSELYEDNTPMVSFSDGAAYDPQAGVWRNIPPAWPEGEHVYGRNPPSGRLSSVPIPGGLFVWGMSPTEDRVNAATYDFDTEMWTELDTGAGPPLRRRSVLSYREGYVYLFGGAVPRSDTNVFPGPPPPYGDFYRDLWRYSLATGRWEQIVVPDYADLQASSADWTADGLLFFGHQCDGASVYDPELGWRPVTIKNAPVAAGTVSSFSQRAVVHDIWDGLDGPIDAVWVYEP